MISYEDAVVPAVFMPSGLNVFATSERRNRAKNRNVERDKLKAETPMSEIKMNARRTRITFDLFLLCLMALKVRGDNFRELHNTMMPLIRKKVVGRNILMISSVCMLVGEMNISRSCSTSSERLTPKIFNDDDCVSPRLN